MSLKAQDTLKAIAIVLSLNLTTVGILVAVFGA